MPPSLAQMLSPEKALIFRITHRDNLPHLLSHGISCATAPNSNPDFVSIGNEDLIRKRPSRVVPAGPGGTLSDYVPFYFTPCSPMLYNIKTGFHGVRPRSMSEIAVLVTSLAKLEQDGIVYLITDRHAYLQTAEFWDRRDRCGELPWGLWQGRNFKRESSDPAQFERYQAEILVHEHLPARTLLGIVVYDQAAASLIAPVVTAAGIAIPVKRRPEWYP